MPEKPQMPPSPAPETPDNSTVISFMVVLGVAVVFLVAVYYLPARSAKPKKEPPRPPRSMKPAGMSKIERESKEFVDSFHKAMGGEINPDRILRELDGQLQAIQNDPRYTPEERAELERQLRDTARQAGS